jgi:hypothetical protein
MSVEENKDLPEEQILIDEDELELAPEQTTQEQTEEVKTVAEAPAQEAPLEEEKEPVLIKPRAEQFFEQTLPHNAETQAQTDEELWLGSDTLDRTHASLQNADEKAMPNNPNTFEWAKGIQESLDNYTYGSALSSRLSKPGSMFTQGLEYRGVNFGINYPMRHNVENKVISGEQAAMHVFSHLGLGDLSQVSLWHSGFHVIFKPPTNSAIIELTRQITKEKILMGRSSYGLIYSNYSYYMVDRLLDFMSRHIYSISADGITASNFRDYVRIQDLYPLILGFVCSMYPRGFKYNRPCLENPNKCQHIERETINLTRIYWIDRNAFTEEQKLHMSARKRKSRTLDEVLKYQASLEGISTKQVKMKTSMAPVDIVLRSPTLSEYIDSGDLWISSIAELVDKAMGEQDINEKNNAIQVHSKSTVLRVYSHWADKIIIGSNVIEDRETIDNTLNILSSDDVAREDFMKLVSEYIDSSSNSIVGIPTYECPVCGTEQNKGQEGVFKNIIPIDVLQVFFSIISSRVENIIIK